MCSRYNKHILQNTKLYLAVELYNGELIYIYKRIVCLFVCLLVPLHILAVSSQFRKVLVLWNHFGQEIQDLD